MRLPQKSRLRRNSVTHVCEVYDVVQARLLMWGCKNKLALPPQTNTLCIVHILITTEIQYVEKNIFVVTVSPLFFWYKIH